MGVLNVLLIDDDHNLVRTLSLGLRKALGEEISVSVCFSGSEALSMQARQAFDLVICDFHLPEMSGLDLLQRIKQDRLETTLVLMTAYGTEELEKQAHQLAIGFITKPFELSALVEWIASHDREVTTSGAVEIAPHFGENIETTNHFKGTAVIEQEGSQPC